MGLETLEHGIGMSQRTSMLESTYLHSRGVLERWGRWRRQSSAPAPSPGWGGEFEGKPLPLAMVGLLPVKSQGTIPSLPSGTDGEQYPGPSSLLLLMSCSTHHNIWALPMPLILMSSL